MTYHFSSIEFAVLIIEYKYTYFNTEFSNPRNEKIVFYFLYKMNIDLNLEVLNEAPSEINDLIKLNRNIILFV